MIRLFLLLSLFLAAFQSAAQTCNYLAYDGFSYPDNSPLESLQGGAGWLQPWNVQSENTQLPGYQISTGTPLQFQNLQTTPGYASGGLQYLTAGRRLNVQPDGPFAAWLNADGAIGLPGTSLWMSILLRKNQNNDETVAAFWHNQNIQWCEGCTSNKVAVGYFGANSNVNGQRRWTLRLGDQYFPTSIPVVIGEAAFLVLKLDFNANSISASCFVNPAQLGNDTPTPELTQTSPFALAIRSVALYLGNNPNNGQADELRMGASYACVAPDPNVAVNQPPNAAFAFTPASGIAPLQISFDGTPSSDPDGFITAYSWDFGDGSAPVSGGLVNHTFTALGNLNVRLTVTDSEGLQHSLTKQVRILDPSGVYPCLLGITCEQLASCTGNDGRFRVTNYENIPLQLRNASGNLIPPSAGNAQVFDNLAPGPYQLTASGANGCRDTFNLQIQRDSNTCPGWTPDPCAMKIGVGIEGLAYWSTGRPFKDFFKSCGTWITYDPNPPGGNFIWNTENQAHIPTDSNGYALQIPFPVPNGSGQNLLRGIISAIGHIPTGVPMRLLYDGVGTLQMQGNVTVTASQPGQIDFVVNDEGNIFFNLTASQAGNHVRNIRVVEQSNLDTYLSQPFRQSFLDNCKEFNTLRFMDWMRTNGSEHEKWENRTRPGYYSQAESLNGGLAYEYIIQLANTLNKDIWVCVPHGADDTYIAEMAAMFRNGLNSGIQVYLEYSNEVWNWIFPQAHWVNNNGPQNISYPRRYVERSLHAFDIWMQVWGSEQTRLRRVLGTQNGYDWITEEIMAHADPTKYDYISPSWYVGLDHGDSGVPNLQALGAAATVEDVLENANNTFLGFYPHWELVYRNAKLYGKKVANYEGGQHFTNFTVPPYIQAMYDAQVHPGMYELYNRMLDSLRRLGSELPLAFVLTGPWQSQYGSWGHLFSEDDPAPWTDRPKFQVLLDQIARCVEVSGNQELTPIVESLTVFPNPSTGAFQLIIPENWQGQSMRLRAYDARGVQHALMSWNNIPTGEFWPCGLYLLQLEDQQGRVVARGKWVKVKGH
ncbi:MAG: PKD domain-containing protein [Chitinophagales bacterium]|nr:PKD domain-containing protein [Chitinophagales bacterium]